MSVDTIGSKLIKLRNGKSRPKVAQALGISESALWMYENNQRVPRDEIKMKIADYYGLTVGEIFFAPKCHKK